VLLAKTDATEKTGTLGTPCMASQMTKIILIRQTSYMAAIGNFASRGCRDAQCVASEIGDLVVLMSNALRLNREIRAVARIVETQCFASKTGEFDDFNAKHGV
jgi:hypothetical protein